MKTESQVFFEETKPYVESLAERINPQTSLNMTWAYPYLEPLMQERDMEFKLADPSTKGPAISIGSGPSLDACIPYLNRAREVTGAPIFCTSSQVWTLYYQGVTPDYVTQHDPWSRRCPLCTGINELGSLIYYDEDGTCRCGNGHVITGDDRERLIRATNIHRWAPEIGCTPLFHPGVALETLRWPDLAKRGEMYITNFNPNMGPYMTRDVYRGKIFGRSGEEYRVLEQSQIMRLIQEMLLMVRAGTIAAKDAEQMFDNLVKDVYDKLNTGWEKMILTMMKAPGKFEPQDTPMWQAGINYGEGNPRIKHPVRVGAPYAPSTTFQNAILAFMKGYNPIYFVGYDLCHWKGYGYHSRYFHDGTKLEKRLTDPGSDVASRKAINGFTTDYVQVGEKYALAGYVSANFKGYYSLPGLQVVEVIAEGTPGNLEFYPKVDIERFAEGETRDVSPEKTAKKIEAIVRKRKMDKEVWQQ